MNAEREQILQELRPVSFAIAYRMLGSVAEAEDVVQDALLKLDTALVSSSGDQVAARVPRDGDHPPRHRPAALGARPPGALRG